MRVKYWLDRSRQHRICLFFTLIRRRCHTTSSSSKMCDRTAEVSRSVVTILLLVPSSCLRRYLLHFRNKKKKQRQLGKRRTRRRRTMRTRPEPQNPTKSPAKESKLPAPRTDSVEPPLLLVKKTPVQRLRNPRAGSRPASFRRHCQREMVEAATAERRGRAGTAMGYWRL